MSENSQYALWLCSWYPNKLEPLTGDFIQRHAQAVALYLPVHVVAIIHDAEGKITQSTLVENTTDGNFSETILYYHTPQASLAIVNKFLKYFGYFFHGNIIVNDFLQRKGLPKLIHAHVAVFAGILAYKISKRINIPYFISEHWTAYLKEASPNFADFNFLVKRKWRQAMKKATNISAVSTYLSSRLEQLSGRQVIRIPNVVDTNLFAPTESKLQKQLIHISTFTSQKQVDQILQAFGQTIAKMPAANLVMVGPNRPDLIEMSNALGLANAVIWKEEMPQSALVPLIGNSSALILYSAYETFGCVVIEANALGIPVIVSDITALQEIVQQGANGWLVPNNNIDALAEAMCVALHSENQKNMGESCRQFSASFSYNRVGKEFIEFYSNR